jgi:hypothetical protein
MDQHTTCSICLEPLPSSVSAGPSLIRLDCSHQFHKHCIRQWYRIVSDGGRSPSCPMCRQIIPPHIDEAMRTPQLSSSRHLSSRIQKIAKGWYNSSHCQPFGPIELLLLLMSWPPSWGPSSQLFINILSHLYQFILLYHIVKTSRTSAMSTHTANTFMNPLITSHIR